MKGMTFKIDKSETLTLKCPLKAYLLFWVFNSTVVPLFLPKKKIPLEKECGGRWSATCFIEKCISDQVRGGGVPNIFILLSIYFSVLYKYHSLLVLTAVKRLVLYLNLFNWHEYFQIHRSLIRKEKHLLIYEVCTRFLLWISFSFCF